MFPMTDAEFDAFLEMCRLELEEKQPLFENRLCFTGRKWFYELGICKLSVNVTENEGGDVLDITPIATYSKKYGTWMWAWANEDFPSYARDKARRLYGLYETTGFEVFRQNGLPVSPQEVDRLLALSVHQLDGIGFFRAPSEEPEMPALFLSIDKPSGHVG